MSSERPTPNARFQWERYTDRARMVIRLAQQEAHAQKHTRIETVHLLLGLIDEREGVAARVLESLRIDGERIRAEVVATMRSGENVTSGQIPFTEHVEKVLESAIRESEKLNDNYLGTEHLLLALTADTSSGAVRILLKMGAEVGTIRTRVLSKTPARNPVRPWVGASTPLLAPSHARGATGERQHSHGAAAPSTERFDQASSRESQGS